MFYLNKAVGWLASPLGVGLLLMLAALVFAAFRRRRLAIGLGMASFVWFWAWSTPAMTRIVGAPLEARYIGDWRIPAATGVPYAEAIVLLGGGMSFVPDEDGAEMTSSSDRIWHAARLLKAGWARRIVATGSDARKSTESLLLDFGVSTNAIEFIESARNTEEEAKAIAKWCSSIGIRPHERLLVVTSAWHMDRAILMMEKFAPQVNAIPAPADFEATRIVRSSSIGLLPSADTFMFNSMFFREHLGYWGYRIVR